MHKFIKFMALLLIAAGFVYANGDRPVRGDIIISEVVLDDDGIYAAIPRSAGVTRTADTDIRIELKNVSGKTLDYRGLRLFYIVEPYDELNPADTNFDLCGMSEGATNIQSLDVITVRDAGVSGGGAPNGEHPTLIAANEYFVIQEYGQSDVAYNKFGGDANPGYPGGYFFRRSNAWTPASNLPVHPFPGPAANYATTAQNRSYHTFMAGGMRGMGTNLAVGYDTLIDVGDGIAAQYTDSLAQNRGLPRVCVGNRFTNSGFFRLDGLDGASGVEKLIDAQNFTLMLFSTNATDDGTGTIQDLLDVFSMGEANAQSDLALLLSNPGAFAAQLAPLGITPFPAYTYSFATALEMFDLVDDGALLTGRALHEVSFSRFTNTENRASNTRADFYKTVSSIGAASLPVPGGGSNLISSATVSLNRRGTAVGSEVLVFTSAANPGDPKSKYKIVATTTTVDPVSAMTARVVQVGGGFNDPNPSRAMTLVGNQWEAEFQGILTDVDTNREYQIEFSITPVTGSPSTTVVASTSFFARNMGPLVSNVSRTNPSGAGPVPDNSNFSISASILDTGTVNLGAVAVSLIRTDTSAVGSPQPMAYTASTGTISASTSFNINGINGIQNGVQYCFSVTANDEFNSPSTGNSCSSPFTVLKGPALKDVSVEVAPGASVTIDINTATYLEYFNYPGAPGSVTVEQEDAGDGTYATCSLIGSNLTIVAATTGSGGFCTLRIRGNTGGQETTKGNQRLNVIPDANATVLREFKVAPAKDLTNPTALDNRTVVSFSDFLEVEAWITDGNGIDSSAAATSVILHFVVTDPASGVSSLPRTAYSVYLYNNGEDFRQAPGMPAGADFGSRWLYGYTLNDNNRIFANSSVSPSGVVTFPPGPGGPNFFAFRIDPGTDEKWHIAIKPFDFQVSTDFRLDLEIKDNLQNRTYLPNIGNVRIAAGPGYVLRPVKDTWNEGDVSERTIALKGFECNAPFNVGTRKCGSAGNNQLTEPEHTSLTWYVETFDGKSDPPTGPRTGFFQYVNPAVTPETANTQDQFLVRGNAEACGTGRIVFALQDSQGFRVTTDEFSVNVPCTDDPPVYAANPSGPVTAPENASGFSISLLSLASELSQLGMPAGAPLYGETPTNQLVWEVIPGHPSQSTTILTTFEIVGSSLVVTATPNVFHTTGASDSIVVCVRDGAGQYASNGTLNKDATPNACSVLQVRILDILDFPFISTTGAFPVSPIPSPININEDTPTTVQVGVWDVDGPYPATFSFVKKADPFSALSSIAFSNRKAVGTTGETWDMLITPSLNKSGVVTVEIKAQTGVQFVTQQVVINILPGNDQPTITTAPCARNPVSEKEDWGTTTSNLNFSAVSDIDLTDAANPSTPQEYRWAVSAVQFNGFVPVGSGETQGMTAVAGTQVVTPVAGSFVDVGVVKVQASGDGTGGMLTFQSNPFAYGTATVTLRITDQNGAGLFAENSQCSINIESVTNPPVIKQSIFAATRVVNEDQEGYFFDLSPYELDPFNSLASDADLFWSVNIAEPTTLFQIIPDYPAYFKNFLHAENQASGVYARMRFGPDSSINTADGNSAIGPAGLTTDTTRAIDPLTDRLFIRTAPDAHGNLPLLLTLNRTGSTPVTTRIDFTIAPTNDPVRITMLNDAGTAQVTPFINLEEVNSQTLHRLTTWENDARDFTAPVTGNGLVWDENFISSGDTTIFTVGCPPPSAPGAKFFQGQSEPPGPTATRDDLCLNPNTNIAYLQSSTVLNLRLNDKVGSGGTPATLAVPATLFGHNDYPNIDFVSSGISFDTTLGRYVWRISEGAGARTSDLKPMMKDEEDALSGSEKSMLWFMDDFPKTLAGTGPGLVNKSLTLGGFPFTLSIDQVSKVLTYSTTVPQLSGVATPAVTFYLCDSGSPFFEEVATNSTRTSRKCSMASVQFVIDAINDAPTLSIPPLVQATVFTAPEGSCLSVDMTPFITDPDTGSSQITMSLATGGVINQTVDQSIFHLPYATTSNFILSAGQFGRETSCALQELDLAQGPLSRSAMRMFGTVLVNVKLTDNQGASSITPLTLTFSPVWEAPSVGISSAWSTSPLTSMLFWSVKEDSSTSSIFLGTNVPDQILLDRDLGYGERILDFNWSLRRQGLVTNHLDTSTYSMTLQTSLTGTWLSLSVKPDAHLTADVVALGVRDTQGLSGVRELFINIAEVNDLPFLTSRPSFCGLTAENSCVAEDTTTYLALRDFISDAKDSPQDPLIFRILSNPLDICTSGSSLPGVLTTANSIFQAAVETERLRITGLPNRYHPKNPSHNNPQGDILRLCATDSRSVEKRVLETFVEVFIRPVNDAPVLTSPIDLQAFSLLEDVSQQVLFSLADSSDTTATGLLTHHRFISERISDLGTNPTVIATSVYELSQIGNQLLLKTSLNQSSPLTEFWRVKVVDTGDTWENRFGPSETTTSVRLSLVSSPVNDAPLFCEVTSPGCVPRVSIDWTASEDTSAQFALNQFLKLTDPEPTQASNYRFSLSSSGFVTQADYALSTGRIVRFQLINPEIPPNGRDGYQTVVRTVLLTEETNGTVQNFSLHLRDESELPVLVSTLAVNLVFQPINDPPRFVAAIPQISVSKNATNPVSVNLSGFKFDPDTAIQQVCYSVVAFNPSMIQAYLPSGYGPAVFNQGNCAGPLEQLLVFPLPGVSGTSNVSLAIYDTTDLSSVTTSVSVQILATEPAFDRLQKPSVAQLGAMVLTAPGLLSFAAQDLVVDDQPVAVNLAKPNFFLSENELNTQIPIVSGQRLLNLNLDYVNVRINPSTLRLEVSPDYSVFSEGTRTFWLYFEDADGNIGKMVSSVSKRHAFVRSVLLDDVDGNSQIGFGDRLLLEFSRSSGGIRGLRQADLSYQPLSISNLASVVVAQAQGVDIPNNAFGIPTPYAVELYDPEFNQISASEAASGTKSDAYFLQITLREGLNQSLDGVKTSHSLTVPLRSDLRFQNDVTSTQRSVTLTPRIDKVPPRLMQAQLLDVDKDTRYRAGDRIQLRFSETLQGVTAPISQLLLPSGLDFGSGSYYTHSGNEITVVLGSGAFVDLSSQPSLMATTLVRDIAGNSIDTRRRQLVLQTTDQIGPRIISVEYDKRSAGINYVAGDRIRVRFDEPVQKALFTVANLDSMLSLTGFATFGSNPGIRFDDGDTLLEITLGQLTAGLGPQVALKAAASVLDLAGNPSGKGELIADRGISLPGTDTVPPSVSLQYSRAGKIFDFFNPLTVINAGDLLIEADFTEAQAAVPRISIENGPNLVLSQDAMTQKENSTRPLQLWYYRHRIASDDGLNRVLLEGAADPISGLPLGLPANNTFFVDTLMPVLQMPLLAGNTPENPVLNPVLNVQGSSNEDLQDIRVTVQTAQGSVSASIGLIPGSSKQFLFLATNLNSGENRFRIVGTDMAGNPGEIIKSVWYQPTTQTPGGPVTPVEPVVDLDWDRDGVPNSQDAFPRDPTEWEDTDGDGNGDNRDSDDDGDGIPDELERAIVVDGRVYDFSKDSDNDGIPNVFDTDLDGDGIANELEDGYLSLLVPTGKVLDFNNDGIPAYEDPVEQARFSTFSAVEFAQAANTPKTEESVFGATLTTGSTVVRIKEQVLLIPQGGKDITYDMSGLGTEYRELTEVTLPRTANLQGLFPVVAVRPEVQSRLQEIVPSGFEALGSVLSIRGRVKPGTTVDFPFPLPSYFKNNTIVRPSDLRLQYFDTLEGKWMDSGTPVRIDGAVLTGRIGHFSEWRVLRNTGTVFDNNAGGSLGSVSSGGGGGGGGGCFIVTASTGKDSVLVKLYSLFRDHVLLQSALGRDLVAFYYEVSPVFANALGAMPALRFMIALALWALALGFPILIVLGLLLRLAK